MNAIDALNKVAKWRILFTGWQLGTRPKGDPEGDAVRDHREGSIILRVEVSALLALCVEKGLFSQQEREAALVAEAAALEKLYEAKFPGVKATSEGLHIDRRALAWMKGWKP